MLMEEKEQEITQMKDAMLEKADKVEKVLQQAARVLACEYQLCDALSRHRSITGTH